ncbi:hypothetical protein RintRC_2627 [Richelia intracellularis]|nr:hypothetical protein RintRC_2627 [Richelia intracellularis]
MLNQPRFTPRIKAPSSNTKSDKSDKNRQGSRFTLRERLWRKT